MIKIAYVDYYRDGKWGAWYNRKMIGLPNVIHHSPAGVCKTLAELAKAQNIQIGLHLSDAIKALHAAGWSLENPEETRQ